MSVDSAGRDANGDSAGPAISPDGRFVAFQSGAFNLVPGDNNGSEDVFVHDRLAGTTERVSVTSAGGEANSGSSLADITAHGRLVAFTSAAQNLTPEGSGNFFQVFVLDRLTSATELISKDRRGNPGDRNSAVPSLSADGRFVAFETQASNLIPGGAFPGQVLVRESPLGPPLRPLTGSGGSGHDRSLESDG